MADKITIGHMYPNGIHPSALRKAPATDKSISTGAQATPFQHILDKQFVRFSHHAEMRLQQRGIELKPEQLMKLETAIDKAAAKGAKDTLMVLGGTALIVNVPNRTVVTAMDGLSMKDNVFTQIDSAVVIS
ncbi:flagellar biosynthesis protein [Paenibacillus sp. N1-5-1-14]|uniref:TIGR02530 family flagellar biosynthesis protein n=1 Tax=Paenibacillus radicibacter TaxID=2972488 RepID=UPI002158D268|nr:TIGR02530 family flagellar biosynthesis protein [Paenibacillus radicibacter]MCR8642187.1 flagellar biosynthesis protein [Paenibacillus radicibacter]